MLWDVFAAVRGISLLFSTPKRPAPHADRTSNKRARIHTVEDSADASHQAGQSSLVGPSATNDLDTSSPARPFSAARFADGTPRHTLPSQARSAATVDGTNTPSSRAPLQHLYAGPSRPVQHAPAATQPHSHIFRSPVCVHCHAICMLHINGATGPCVAAAPAGLTGLRPAQRRLEGPPAAATQPAGQSRNLPIAGMCLL